MTSETALKSMVLTYRGVKGCKFDRDTQAEDGIWRRFCPISGHCFEFLCKNESAKVLKGPPPLTGKLLGSCGGNKKELIESIRAKGIRPYHPDCLHVLVGKSEETLSCESHLSLPLAELALLVAFFLEFSPKRLRGETGAG